jgi:hypothetical protein
MQLTPSTVRVMRHNLKIDTRTIDEGNEEGGDDPGEVDPT